MSPPNGSNAKRKRRKKTVETEESSTDERRENTTEHESISIQVGRDHFDLELGDTVLIDVPGSNFGSEWHRNTINPSMIARVERIWEEGSISTGTKKASSSIFKFRARWFIPKSMIDSMPCLQDISHRIKSRELILTNKVDDNFVTTIREKVQVIYRRPDSDSSLPSLPDDTFVCRYSVDFESNSNDQCWIQAFKGEEDSWAEMYSLARQAKRRRSRASTPSFGATASDSDSDESSVEKCIRVGLGYQVPVPNFETSSSTTFQNDRETRKPTLVWKAGSITEEELSSFVEQLSEVLYSYLKENRLTQEEPYSPLGWDEIEAVIKRSGSNTLPTLSTMCTVSSLCDSGANTLREFDIDSIMELLHKHDYQTDKALMTIRKSPQDYLTLWTLSEKESFNFRFKRYAGSVRMIWKGISSSKGFQDIIDYQYRFKIPDQFRCFQNKKREKAVQMVEAMEARHTTKSVVKIEKGKDPSIRMGETPKLRGEWYVPKRCLMCAFIAKYLFSHLKHISGIKLPFPK